MSGTSFGLPMMGLGEVEGFRVWDARIIPKPYTLNPKL